MDRRGFVGAVFGAVLSVPVATFAQQQAPNRPRIGFLSSESASNQSQRLDALRAGLQELGYVDGRNLVIEVRWAEGKYERLPALATELVNLKVEAIVTSGIKATMAAKRATVSIPIVMETGDAIAEGMVASLARPGGNITGWTFFGPQLTAKRLELLRECIPSITAVAFLVNQTGQGSSLPVIRAAADRFKIRFRQFEVRSPQDFDSAFVAMVQDRCNALVVQGDTMFAVNAKAVADLAIEHRLPSAGIIEYPAAGGLIGYGADLIEGHRRLAPYLDKILKGAKPADLPVEQATTFDLAINVKTAKALSVVVPQPLLLRAKSVIE